jgi:hypothetical protein
MKINPSLFQVAYLPVEKILPVKKKKIKNKMKMIDQTNLFLL